MLYCDVKKGFIWEIKSNRWLKKIAGITHGSGSGSSVRSRVSIKGQPTKNELTKFMFLSNKVVQNGNRLAVYVDSFVPTTLSATITLEQN